MKHRIGELLRFGVVGTVGFLTDAGVLTALVSLAGWLPLPARLVSFPIALTVTWLLNRHWTFTAVGPSVGTGTSVHAGFQYVTYAAVQLISAAINFAVYTALLQLGGVIYRWPVIALAVGSVVAMAFSYMLSRRFVFRADATASTEPE